MTAKKKAKKVPVIVSVKGLDKNFCCRDFQFEVGKTYKHEGPVAACESEFHACENPLDVLSYYSGDCRFALVEQSGKISKHLGDTKIASAVITIKAELTLPEFITRAFDWVVSKCSPATSNHATGDQSASSATGYRSASSATGYMSASSATGYMSASSATGYRSASSATGNQSASSATGDWSASSATGDWSASSATGDQSASSATGDWSASSATGDQSASSATGYRSASSATGYQSASSATGYRSASSATGKNSVAMNIGIQGKARAGEDGAIVLCNHDEHYNIRHIRASKVGENGIKPDVFYILDDNGEFREAA